jgi:hypothetical protein
MDCPAAVAFGAALLEMKERTGRSYRELARCGYVSAAALHRYCQGRPVPAEFTAIERIALRHGVPRRQVERLRALWMKAVLEESEAPALT